MKNLSLLLLILMSSILPARATAPGADCDAEFTFTVDGLTVSFTDASTADPGPILEWMWDFGDGTTSTDPNPVHTYAEPGEYDVCLTIHADGACWDDVCESNIPVAGGGECMVSAELAALDGTSAQFIGAVTPAPDVVTYTWIFGDGSTFTETTAGTPSDPVHTYAEPGVYNVCVVIETGGGCVDEYCFEIEIPGGGGDCTADFEFVTDGFTASFYETATATGDIIEYFWEFGDGTTSTDPNPEHTYTLPGTYEVCLTIFVAGGCSDTWCDVVVIGGGGDCESDFEFDTDGLSVHFFETADGGGDDIVSYAWSFGDGTGSDIPNPVHTYAADGVYLVCLTIITADGCMSTFCDEVVVEGDGGPCEAYFVVTDITLTPDGYVVHFNNESAAAGDIVSTLWYFGDGTSDTTFDGEHLYTESGAYVVCLVITTADGCVDEYCFELVLGEGEDCVSEFNFEVSGLYAYFEENADGAGADIVSYYWSFGDGGTSDEPNPEYMYATPGDYEVCLTITTGDGCLDTWCDVVTIEAPEGDCEADFEIDDITETDEGWLVAFDNDSDGDELYTWTFGDGSGSEAENPEHIYAESGVYLVCLTVGIAGTDCYDEFCMEVYVGGDDDCISEEMIDSTYACTEEYDPVCGCNGVTYSNACYAQYYGGVIYWTEGACGGTGIQEETIIGTLQVSPNPAVQQANIQFSAKTTADVRITVLNTIGEVMLTPIEHTVMSGTYAVSLDVTSLSSGIYIVQVSDGQFMQTAKLMITR